MLFCCTIAGFIAVSCLLDTSIKEGLQNQMTYENINDVTSCIAMYIKYIYLCKFIYSNLHK